MTEDTSLQGSSSSKWSDAGLRFVLAHTKLMDFIGFISTMAIQMDTTLKGFKAWLIEHVDVAEKLSEQDAGLCDSILLYESQTWDHFTSYNPLMYQMFLSRSVDNFLTFISELLVLIFQTRPETMRSNKMVKFVDILRYKTMDELITYLAEERVNELAYKGMRELADEISKGLGFDLFPRSEDLDKAIYLVEVRNLIVHNRGVINRLFLSRQPSCSPSIGQSLELKPQFILDSLRFLGQAALDIDNRASTKFNLPSPSASDLSETLRSTFA